LPLHNTFSYYGAEAEGDDPPKSDVRDVYDSGSKQLRARTLSKFKILAQLPRKEWHEGYFKKLLGGCEGLWEVRFVADHVEQRPLGFHINETEFVILLWAKEKSSKFIPKNACEIALRRKEEVLANARLKHAFWLELE
jgi:hypothetical protein